jgi:hypothetical protein
VWGSGPQTDKHLSQSPFTGPVVVHSKSLIFYNSRYKQVNCGLSNCTVGTRILKRTSFRAYRVQRASRPPPGSRG